MGGACGSIAATAIRCRGVRRTLFATYRHSIDGPKVSELVIGVELSPTFFLPPVTWFRIGGGPPI
jgi:hypothetical protein